MTTRAQFVLLALALSFGCVPTLAQHAPPKDRAALQNRDWLPYVVSKIAPLEWWSFATSLSDLRWEDYPSDYQYEQAKADSLFPRFCFSLFRPKPQQMASLISAMSAYKGDVNWVMGDDCIVAMPAMPELSAPLVTTDEQEKFQAMLYKSAHPDAEFVKQAMLDAPRLAAFLESHLNLAGRSSLDFDPQWLTSEGLAASRGRFADYWEPGSWAVFLAREPQQYAGKFESTSPQDRSLTFGIAAYEMDALFDELSPGWEAFQREEGPVLPAYPLLSRLSDMTADALYERNEVDALLDECLQTQARVRTPDAIRGLDNLLRIARWAQKLKVGIYFGAQNP